jgi:hypothetical protein
MIEVLTIATALYAGWSYDWDGGMIVTSPAGYVYRQDVPNCRDVSAEDEGYDYFTAWVDSGSPQPDRCLVKVQ